jgi:hypothetical protein
MAATPVAQIQVPVTLYFDVTTNSFTDPSQILAFLQDQLKVNYASAVSPGSKFTIVDCKTSPHT